jgi:hypothetical protein
MAKQVLVVRNPAAMSWTFESRSSGRVSAIALDLLGVWGEPLSSLHLYNESSVPHYEVRRVLLYS